MAKLNSKDEALEVVRTLPIDKIMDLAADALMAQQQETFKTNKIAITMDDFFKHFSIAGYNIDRGDLEKVARVETRGRRVRITRTVIKDDE